MLIQRRPGKSWFQIDRFKIAVSMTIALCCLCAPRAVAQPIPESTVAGNPDPILSAQLDLSESSLMESGIQPEAVRMYLQAVRELRRGQPALAEKDARRAVVMDARFADADTLAATAALAQRQFARACDEAGDAARIDVNDEKAWVVLATADNYLAEYDDAIDALQHVRVEHWTTWQVAYQWSRAEAGLSNAAQTLEWANRAALTAPSGFAPLHLLQASALLAARRHGQAADELETYLQLLNRNAPEREGLTRELKRIRGLPQTPSGEIAEYNALRN
jgi:hypothetical protein